MGVCSAPNCKSTSEKNCSLFRFPADKARRRQWIINCRRKDWLPGPGARLCFEHFEESQFETKRADNWKKLKPNAIPTLFNFSNPPTVIASKHIESKKCPKPESVPDCLQMDDAVNTIPESDSLLERIAYPYEREIKIIKLLERIACLEKENKTLKLEVESRHKILSFLSDKQIVFSGKQSTPTDLPHPDLPSLFSLNEENALTIGRKLLLYYEKNLKRSKDEEFFETNFIGKSSAESHHSDCVPSVSSFNQSKSLLQHETDMNCSINEESFKNSCKGKSSEENFLESAVPSMIIDDNPLYNNPHQKKEIGTMTELTMKDVSKLDNDNLVLKKNILILENVVQRLKLLNND